MTHGLHVVRWSVLSLLVAAGGLAIITVARQPSPATIVVVPVHVETRGYSWVDVPRFCAGYDWRRSSIDLRPYCGY